MRERDRRARQRGARIKLGRENQRLSRLAIEIGLAMSQILMQEYGFTAEQCNDILTKVTAQAKQNREAPAREQAPI